jgi:GNAT superfamily N-acetyltransferase
LDGLGWWRFVGGGCGGGTEGSSGSGGGLGSKARGAEETAVASGLECLDMDATSQLLLRPAGEPDFAALIPLVNAAYEVEGFFLNGNRLDTERARAFLEKGSILLAEENGVLIGCVYVEPRGERCYFGLLSVSPSQQKRGLGRRLIAAAEEFARKSGARFMDLTVVSLRTELPPFYEKAGYAVTGTEPAPVELLKRSRQACHLICMSKVLGDCLKS